MNITPNFTLEELVRSTTATKLGIDNNKPSKEVELNLIMLCYRILQPIRNKYGKPITVTSGYRSKALNDAVKGAKNSDHLNGNAADIKCANNSLLFHIIKDMVENKEIEVGQLINEHNFSWVHVSLPTKKHHNKIFAIN